MVRFQRNGPLFLQTSNFEAPPRRAPTVPGARSGTTDAPRPAYPGIPSLLPTIPTRVCARSVRKWCLSSGRIASTRPNCSDKRPGAWSGGTTLARAAARPRLTARGRSPGRGWPVPLLRVVLAKVGALRSTNRLSRGLYQILMSNFQNLKRASVEFWELWARLSQRGPRPRS